MPIIEAMRAEKGLWVILTPGDGRVSPPSIRGSTCPPKSSSGSMRRSSGRRRPTQSFDSGASSSSEALHESIASVLLVDEHPASPRPTRLPLSVGARRRGDRHEPGRRIVAIKNVTVNEEFFQGHFPGTPLMPGVLMIESLTQVATLLLGGMRFGGPARAAARGGQRQVPAAGRAGRPARARSHDGAPPRRDRAGRRRGVGRRSRRRRSGARDRRSSRRCARTARVDGAAAGVADVPMHETAIVHPGAVHRRRHGRRAVRDDRSRRRDRPAVPGRRLGGHRRRHGDRRPHRDLPVRVDRPGAAGSEVPGRADAARDRPATTSFASS